MIPFFRYALRVKGFPMREAAAVFEEISAVPEADFESHITQKRTEIARYHLKHNPLYRSLVQNGDPADWKTLPVMTKKHFQKPLYQRLSDDFSAKNVYVNKTSGSSGDPFIFAKDRFCHALTWCNIIRRFGWYGIDFNRSFQARFYGIPLDFWGNKKERLKDWLGNRYRFSIFDLSDRVLEKILTQFSHKKFDYINGYTSSVVLFAKFLEQKRIVLTTVCPSLKCCVVTSEMLFETDKKRMETWFGVPVINEYGASELDLIAFENPKGEWQVNSETLYVEILDDNNEVLPFGSEGRVVITSLYNKAHPFIRYDIGDIGILDEKSTAKKPILKKLTGRTNDIAVLPSGKKAPGLTFYYVTKSLIEDDANVKEFVIIQSKIDTFDIEYVSAEALSTQQIAKMEQAITNYLEEGLRFTFTRKSALQRSKSGKLKQFVSLIPQP